MTGDCYPAALNALFDLGEGELCHGLVTGTGGDVKGVRYGHAWVELEGWVHDRSNGNDVFAPRGWYYKAASVDPAEVVRYTLTEARLTVLHHEHYGPWHGEHAGAVAA